MRTHGGLSRCPISTQQRAAMRAAQQHVERVLEQGCTPEQQAQARAEIAALAQPRQRPLPLKVLA